MTRTFLLGISLAVTLSGAAAAQSYEAYNRVIVNPVSGTSFEAIEGSGYGARGLWCGAADYALRRLGVGGTQRIYVQRPRGPAQTAPGRKGVVFGLDPAGADPRPALVLGASIRQPGTNLSVDHAYQFCSDFRLRNSR